MRRLRPTRWAADLAGDPRVRRILVLKWSALGDVAIASAAFEDLRRAFPAAAIDLNTLPPWDRLFADDPRFRRVIAVDVRGRERGPRGLLRWLRAVRRGRYDVVVDLQSSDRSRALLAALCCTPGAPPLRIGNHRRFPWNVAPPAPDGPVHALERARRALAAAGIRAGTPRPVLHPGKAHRERAGRLLAARGLRPGAYGVFLPGCQPQGYLKRWGARRYAALALALADRGAGPALLLGGPDEREECARIREWSAGAAVDLCGETEVLDLVPLCEGARFVVANDTGTAHVAAAAGRPMVVVCGPTDPRRARPAGAEVRALQAAIWCVNCYRKHCTHHACMALVSAEEVLSTLGALGALRG